MLLSILLQVALAADPAALASAGEFQSVAQAAGVGLKIEMELTRAGTTQLVPLHTPVFKDDQIAFRFTPSEAGHIFIVNKGTSGRYIMLYPYHLGDDNRVTPNQPVRFPPTDAFTVEGSPGDEGIFVIFTKNPADTKTVDALKKLTELTPPPPTPDQTAPDQTAPAQAPPAAPEPEPDELVALSFRSLTRDLRPAPPPERYTVSDTDELRVSFILHHVAAP